MKSVMAGGAGAHDDGNLRDDAGRQHVALEDLGVAAQCCDTLLDAGAAGVVEADDRCAVAQRHLLDLHHLLRMGFGQRAAEHGEVLGEDEDGAAVDGAPAGDDTIARDLGVLHAEVCRAVLDEHVEFFEGAFVEEDLDALARRQLALGMLRIDACLAATGPGDLAPALQLDQNFLHETLFPARPPRPVALQSGLCKSGREGRAYQAPVFFIEAHGSCGGSGLPSCSNSMEMPSGERTKAMLPSRGGRLMVTPASISRWQVS